jgi:hypothetical protein
MAGLALGVPIVTNEGKATERVWRDTRAVQLAGSAEDLAAAAEVVLGDAREAASLGARGRALYEKQFSLEHTVRALRGITESGDP